MAGPPQLRLRRQGSGRTAGRGPVWAALWARGQPEEPSARVMSQAPMAFPWFPHQAGACVPGG